MSYSLIKINDLMLALEKEIKNISYDGQDELLSSIKAIVLRLPIIDAIEIDPLSKWLAKRYEPPCLISGLHQIHYPWTPESIIQAKQIWNQALHNIKDEE
jgi:hypothetical protein